MRHLLLSMKIIEPSDIDPANMVPHVVVRKNNTDPFSKYDSVQGEYFNISRNDLSSKRDFIMIELDKKKDLHMTLIYCKGISKKVDLIEAFDKVLKPLNNKKHLISMYSNLENFGLKEIDYWYETGFDYPNNVHAPLFYSKKKEEKKIPETTEAGTVI